MEFKIIGILLLTILNWLDYYLTIVILKSGGRELNPILRALGLVPVKVVGNIGIGIIIYFTSWISSIIPVLGLLFCCVWNSYQFMKKI